MAGSTRQLCPGTSNNTMDYMKQELKQVVERAHQSISSEHGRFIFCPCACNEVAYVASRMAATAHIPKQVSGTKIHNKSLTQGLHGQNDTNPQSALWKLTVDYRTFKTNFYHSKM